MQRMNRQQFMEMRRRAHEEWLRRQGPRLGKYGIPMFHRYTVDVEGGSAVIRGWGGTFEVRIPAKWLFEPDALNRCGF